MTCMSFSSLAVRKRDEQLVVSTVGFTAAGVTTVAAVRMRATVMSTTVALSAEWIPVPLVRGALSVATPPTVEGPGY